MVVANAYESVNVAGTGKVDCIGGQLKSAAATGRGGNQKRAAIGLPSEARRWIQ